MFLSVSKYKHIFTNFRVKTGKTSPPFLTEHVLWHIYRGRQNSVP